jgi:D-Tyr-tRNAtyr deacylase
MYTTYHLASAQEVNSDILDAIKVAFKSRPITITIEEEDQDSELSQEMKNILDERLVEDESDYITADESIRQLKEKYGL